MRRKLYLTLNHTRLSLLRHPLENHALIDQRFPTLTESKADPTLPVAPIAQGFPVAIQALEDFLASIDEGIEEAKRLEGPDTELRYRIIALLCKARSHFDHHTEQARELGEEKGAEYLKDVFRTGHDKISTDLETLAAELAAAIETIGLDNGDLPTTPPGNGQVSEPSIPERFRTRPMSLADAGIVLHLESDNPKVAKRREAAGKAVRALIDKNKLAAHQLSEHKWIFDNRQVGG